MNIAIKKFYKYIYIYIIIPNSTHRIQSNKPETYKYFILINRQFEINAYNDDDERLKENVDLYLSQHLTNE